MKREVDIAKGWLRKADSDLADVRRGVVSEGPYDTACFHAQQAVEKYLKSLLGYHAIPVPLTHDVEELQRLCVTYIQDEAFAHVELEQLSDYAVSVRYDFEFWPDHESAQEALHIAEQIREWVIRSFPELGE